jgi:putative Holliday junction resolvase
VQGNDLIEKLHHRRVGAIDYGLKRVGFAVCDELHISITPKAVLDPTSDKFWTELASWFERERIALVVVGMPFRPDPNEKTEVITAIEGFIEELKTRFELDVEIRDESFSTIRATETMIATGRKKKDRARKGSKDMIAAAIILRDFLRELD